MESRLSNSCRGCLLDINAGDGYLLTSEDIKKLFIDCVDLRVSGDTIV